MWLTFFGEFRGHGHPHESPAAITIPLQILAVMSIGAGWLAGFGLAYALERVIRADLAALARVVGRPGAGGGT